MLDQVLSGEGSHASYFHILLLAWTGIVISIFHCKSKHNYKLMSYSATSLKGHQSMFYKWKEIVSSNYM